MGPNRKIERAKDVKGSISNLIKSLKRYYPVLIVIFIFSILATVFTIVGPKVLGKATTTLFEGVMAKLSGSGSIDFDKLGKIIITILTLYVVSAIFNYIEGILMANISNRYTEDLRRKINRKIETLPFKYFDKKSNGEVLSLITNDVDTINMNLNRSLSEVISSVTMIVGILVMMFSINTSMTIVTLVILPISMIISAFVAKRSQKYFKERQDNLAMVNSSVEEALSLHLVVKTFNGEEKVMKNLKKANDKLYVSNYKSVFYGGLLYPVMNFIGNIGYVVVAILGGINVVKGNIKVGDIQSFITYTKNFTNPIANLASIFTELQSMIAASERIFEFLDEEEEERVENPIVPLSSLGCVEFKNVTFGYDKGKTIIKNFSAKAMPGKKIAIVGPTGAGKTTIVKLLMRFYELNSGSILVDNIDIKEMDKSSLRKEIGMVLQDAWLFSGTIKDNIKYGKLNATDEEIIRAAKTAHIHHYIETLPEGYNTLLNEETSNISEGEKQLLTIARAILSDPKILILDEATSSVDTRTEELIQKAMDKLMENRTSFIIAHRLSTIKNADLILVLNEGDIVETGTHKELLKKGGFYSKLYNSQFENI